MDPIVQMIVDMLRRGKENEALNKGGLTAGTPEARAATAEGLLPRAVEPKHGGENYEDIINRMSR